MEQTFQNKNIEYTPVDYKDGSPVGSIIIDDGIFQSIDSLAKYCTPGEATNRYIDIIRSAWQPGKAWSEAFSAQISQIFHEYGIIIFNPQWYNIKALFRDIMIAELAEPLASMPGYSPFHLLVVPILSGSFLGWRPTP